ncbi:hypothetical protein [Nocardiopsis suaedae]|uniref:ATP-binding protein n=1 Tax=Nocardiopsis suaedae TaxID=3018444 RepID=A0ABT4TQX5_9ACTN|nr:hypothetical protein [Nocardiopsis suaedae]MDA2807089.1 hypothetical protein [Nocardiopsis suaedae]
MGRPDADQVKLYGRREAVDIVADLRRAPRADAPSLVHGIELDRGPILVVTGMHASGKSALLSRIERECRSRGEPADAVPCVLLDMDAARLRDVPDAVFALSRGLSAHTGTYHGRLRFPRLAAARLFLGPRPDGEDGAADAGSEQEMRVRARERLQSSSRDAARLADRLTDIADKVVAGGFSAGMSEASGASVPVAVAAELLGYTAGSAVALVTRRLPVLLSFRRRLEEVRDWFGRSRLLLPGFDEGAPPDGYLALATLERMATVRRRTGDGDGTLDTVLCQAFLADLRDSYTRMSRHSALLDHRVALIDDAEADPGRDLLHHLLEARRQDRREGAGPDRLTVVATVRFDLFPGSLDDRHRVLVRDRHGTRVRASEDALWGPTAPRERGTPDVLGYRLPLLTRVDCAELAGAMGHRWPDAKRTGRLLHRSVGGHAGAAAVVARHSAGKGPHWPPGHAGPDLHMLLPPFDPDGAPLPRTAPEEELCRTLLGGRVDTWDHTLWVHSAARDGDAAQAVLHPGTRGLETKASRLTADRKDLLWGPDPGFALLRRLLQRRLAHNNGAPHLFRLVHERLAEHYEEAVSDGMVHGAEAGLLYHRLAAEGIGAAAVEAAGMLGKTAGDQERTRAWVAWVEDAASAPMLAAAREEGGPGEAPIDRVNRLASEARAQAKALDAGAGKAVTTVASLLAGLVVARDPFGCPCLGAVHRRVADKYEVLADGGPGDGGALLAASHRHGSEALQD